MRRASAAIAALMTASPSFAQTPDALCATLDTMTSAVKVSPPFRSLVTDWKIENSIHRLGSAPAGLPAETPCGVYTAGTAELGTVGGGTHNYVSCEVASANERAEVGAELKVKAAYEPLLSRVQACMTAEGWKETPTTKRQNGITLVEETIWSLPTSPAEVIVEKTIERRGRDARSMSVTHGATLRVRTPNPADPKP